MWLASIFRIAAKEPQLRRCNLGGAGWALATIGVVKIRDRLSSG
jgi:hypothetical protein